MKPFIISFPRIFIKKIKAQALTTSAKSLRVLPLQSVGELPWTAISAWPELNAVLTLCGWHQICFIFTPRLH